MPDDIGQNDPRVRLAAERTLLAWIRTGVALMGLGFVVARFGLFLQEIAAAEHTDSPSRLGYSLWFGIGLILFGVVVSGLSAREHAHLLTSVARGTAYQPPRRSLAIVVALLLALFGLGMAGYLLVAGLRGL